LLERHVRIIQLIGQKLMSRMTYAAQIDLRFRDTASEVAELGIGVCPSDFARERFHFFG
jgi:hypothetical protein